MPDSIPLAACTPLADARICLCLQVFGVFKYYNDANVKAKHAKAYKEAKAVLARFEATDPRFNGQQLQKAWKEYCTEQATQMGVFATGWMTSTLTSMSTTWQAELGRAQAANDLQAEYYAFLIIDYIGQFFQLTLSGLTIDTSIFT